MTRLDPEMLVTRYISKTNMSSGSGSGVSYWGSFHACPLAYYLDKGTEEERDAAQDDPDIRVGVGYYGGVGICFHKIREIRDLGQWADTEFAYSGNQEPVEWVEALRLDAAYMKEFPEPEWEVAATEWPFCFEAPISWDVFGVPKMTGILDLVVRIRPEQLEAIRTKRGIPVLHPGLYLIDHKVKWRRDFNCKAQWEYRTQFKAYMKAWNLLHGPDEQILGTITNVTYAYKQQKRDVTKGGPKFESFYCPTVSEAEMEVTKRFMQQAFELREVFGLRANTHECFRYSKTCRHHPSEGGTCNLIGEVRAITMENKG